MDRDTLYKDNLSESFDSLKKSSLSFKKSLQKCNAIGIKESYTFEESEAFDSLTSKFSRISDIFIKKVIKSCLILLREETYPLIDMLRNAEKAGIIQDSENLLKVRDIRNHITHEYQEERLNEIFEEVISLSDILLDEITNAGQYIKNRKWVNV